MSTMKSKILTGAALYAIGRLMRDVSMEDLRRWGDVVGNLNTKDLRRFAFDRSDDILHYIGLERRRSPITSALMVAGGVGAGMAIGAGLVVALSPELREKLIERLNGVVESTKQSMEEVKERAAHKADEAAEAGERSTAKTDKTEESGNGGRYTKHAS